MPRNTSSYKGSRPITQELDGWSRGEPEALANLARLVIDDLRRLARHHFAREPKGTTLQPTALVNEIFLRLLRKRTTNFHSRAEFFAVANQLMRKTLIEYSRRRNAVKRGSGAQSLSLEESPEIPIDTKLDQIIALNNALEELNGIEARQCRIVERRFFAGFNFDEIAKDLDISPRTAKRDWGFAKSWLHQKLDDASFLEKPLTDARWLGDEFLKQGSEIGPYTIIEVVERGGMGVVYRASRIQNGKKNEYAVKVITARFFSDDLSELFDNEKFMLARIRHPRIAQFVGAGVEQTPAGRQLPYLALEYIKGTSLDKYCKEVTLSIDDRVALFYKICSIVSFAHHNFVIHGDLKPQNIIINSAAEPNIVDFGIARMLGAANSQHTRHLTPMYASPEQKRGEPMSPASDVYSLGVVLYSLLANKTPQTHDQFISSTSSYPVCKPSAAVPVREIKCQLLGNLDAIVMRCLEEKPQHRYPSAKQLGADIDRHLKGLPIDTKYRKRKPSGNTEFDLGSTYMNRHTRALILVTANGTNIRWIVSEMHLVDSTENLYSQVHFFSDTKIQKNYEEMMTSPGILRLRKRWLMNYCAAWDGDRIGNQLLGQTVDREGAGAKFFNIPIRQKKDTTLTKEILISCEDFLLDDSTLQNAENWFDFKVEDPTDSMDILLIVDLAWYDGDMMRHAAKVLHRVDEPCIEFLRTTIWAKRDTVSWQSGRSSSVTPDACERMTSRLLDLKDRISDLSREENKAYDGKPIVETAPQRDFLKSLELPQAFIFGHLQWSSPIKDSIVGVGSTRPEAI